MKTLLPVLWPLLLMLSLKSLAASESDTITPYKFTDSSMLSYAIPAACRFTTKRLEAEAPDIVYYFSPPKMEHYPIAVMCGGSSSKEDLHSIIHFHRYFLEEFMDLGAGVLTVEQWGIDGSKVDEKEFMEHYTRSQRLRDHQAIIEHLRLAPPKGWNGKLILLGVSEGGPIVTALTEKYSDITLATINWSGAGDWSWQDQLWAFLQKLLAGGKLVERGESECSHHIQINSCTVCLADITVRDRYDARMASIMDDPSPHQYFLNMTNHYHADAIRFPAPDYPKIRTPFLVVAGDQDPLIVSSDAFVAKAKEAGAPLEYIRIAEMDHYVRKRPDIISESFLWLNKIIKKGIKTTY